MDGITCLSVDFTPGRLKFDIKNYEIFVYDVIMIKWKRKKCRIMIQMKLKLELAYAWIPKTNSQRFIFGDIFMILDNFEIDTALSSWTYDLFQPGNVYVWNF